MKQNDKDVVYGQTTVNQLVVSDYRVADVFRRYGISFCCGGNLPLEDVCRIQSLDHTLVQEEIKKVTAPSPFRGTFMYDDWSCHFLIDFINNVHHKYLRQSLPIAVEYAGHLERTHGNKYPILASLSELTVRLCTETENHISQKETVIFPYIKQLANAYEKKESYAGLLVRTLKKPVANLLDVEHRYLNHLLQEVSELTNNFIPPPGSCLTHKVCFAKLADVHYNLEQLLYLENRVLFPKASMMEKACLGVEPTSHMG